MSEQLNILQKHFDTALESPDGIKKLRELILTLAMQGKLVKQDPKDQPAGELLEEIQAEKARLIKEGKIKKQKELPPINPEEVPYEVPEGWVWERLGNLVSKLGSGSTPRGGKEVYSDKGVMFFRSQNVYNDGIRTDKISFIPPAIHEKMANTKILPEDILFNITGGSLGRSALVPIDFKEGNISQHVCIIRPIKIYPKFMHLSTLSRYFHKFIPAAITGGGREGLQKNKMELFPIPLPPLAEQKRIVAKIDELMALCDKLQAQRNERDKKIIAVHRAAIQQLIQPSPLRAFAPSRATSPSMSPSDFLFSNFNPLYSVKENVAELKKAILTLAMQGKLVKQDPEDQPAGELLREIREEKERLIKEGKIKRQKELPPIKPEDIPYGVPVGWVPVRLGEIGFWKSGSTPSRTNQKYYGGNIPWVKSGEVKQGRISKTEEHITEEALKNCTLSVNKKGSVLVAMYGANIGEVGILDIPATTNQAVCACKTYKQFDESYLLHLITSLKPYFLSVGAGAAQPNISREKIIATPVLLPPLAEQKRIVAKIDQLMALCEKLENQIEQTTVKQTELFDAVLAGV